MLTMDLAPDMVTLIGPMNGTLQNGATIIPEWQVRRPIPGLKGDIWTLVVVFTPLTTALMVSASLSRLTHWGQVTHICVGILTIIGSNNYYYLNHCWNIVNCTLGTAVFVNGCQAETIFNNQWQRSGTIAPPRRFYFGCLGVDLKQACVAMDQMAIWYTAMSACDIWQIYVNMATHKLWTLRQRFVCVCVCVCVGGGGGGGGWGGGGHLIFHWKVQDWCEMDSTASL